MAILEKQTDRRNLISRRGFLKTLTCLTGVYTGLNHLYGDEIRDKRGRIIGSVDYIDIENQAEEGMFVFPRGSFARCYVYGKWIDKDKDKWPDCPEELTKANSNIFSEDEDIEFGMETRNLRNRRLSIVLAESNHKKIETLAEGKVLQDKWLFRACHKNFEVSDFIKKYGAGDFYVDFFIEGYRYDSKRFSVISKDISKIRGAPEFDPENP